MWLGTCGERWISIGSSTTHYLKGAGLQSTKMFWDLLHTLTQNGIKQPEFACDQIRGEENYYSVADLIILLDNRGICLW